MKKRLSMQGRTLALIGVLVPLLALFGYVALRSGPLAPVLVTVTEVEQRAIAPALVGIGRLASRYTYRIGPTFAGRVLRVNVEVGDRVRAGQVLAEMDPVDLDQRLGAQQAAQARARASALAAEAAVADAAARQGLAGAQARRYEQLFESRMVSAEAVDAKRQERDASEAALRAARANLDAAQQELTRAGAEQAGLARQRAHLHLVAPVAGLVAARAVDPGSTVVAGQAVVEVIDPAGVWIDTRFDQLRASGLAAGLAARIVTRGQPGRVFAGRVARLEPMADAVTEELLAKVTFDALPEPSPPIGELAEVSVTLGELPAAPAVPSAALHAVDGRLGVWAIEDGKLRFAPVTAGASDLDGRVSIAEGLKAGERVVLYSQRALAAGSRITIVDSLPGVPK
jgi:RND family efflux transporter MFP subunit